MTEADPVDLDDNTLASLARLICGDESAYYRPGRQIAAFFRRSGWPHVPDYDGGYRHEWVLERLRERAARPGALRQVLLRLADPREYQDDDAACPAVTAELNRVLALEGYQVGYAAGRPTLLARQPMLARPAQHAPIELMASLRQIVGDQDFGDHLQCRLDEARTAADNGAYLAAVIMLGSLLEGVLSDVAKVRTGRDHGDNLDTLIKLSVGQGWIDRDVDDYAHTLRQYRNLVHPRRHHYDNYTITSDTFTICWNVAVAALNDLAGT